jgi:hypothetical protein
MKALGIKPAKSGFEKGAKWLWSLPPSSKILTDHEDAHPLDVSTFDERAHLRSEWDKCPMSIGRGRKAVHSRYSVLSWRVREKD